MPLNLDSCIAGVFTPGNIGASSGQTPVQPVVPSFEVGNYGAGLAEGVGSAAGVGAIGATSSIGSAAGTGTATAAGTVARASFDGTTSNVTLSNGNLTVTHSNTTSNSGARSTSLKNSGKYYFEITVNDWEGLFDCCGLLTSAGTFTDIVTNGTNCATVYAGTGTLWGNNANSGKTLGGWADGTIYGIAADLDNEKVWFRKAPSGNWNGLAIGSENPASNLGGVSISSYSATTMGPAVGFGGTGTQAGDNITANFGGAAFSGTVPSGFTAGWPL